jgi:hypothetical protein
MITIGPYHRAACALTFNASEPSCAPASIADPRGPLLVTIASPVTACHARPSLHRIFQTAERARPLTNSPDPNAIQSP